MTYTLSIDRKRTHLHVVVTGENTRNNVLQYVEEVIRACEAADCWYVLVEERLEGPRLGTMDVFDIASQQGRPLGSTVKGVAYVDVNASGDLMQFAEDVAVNRGYPRPDVLQRRRRGEVAVAEGEPRSGSLGQTLHTNAQRSRPPWTPSALPSGSNLLSTTFAPLKRSSSHRPSASAWPWPISSRYRRSFAMRRRMYRANFSRRFCRPNSTPPPLMRPSVVLCSTRHQRSASADALQPTRHAAAAHCVFERAHEPERFVSAA